MASLNKVLIIGHLGQDPETRFLPNGDAVTNISVAATEKWKDKSGEQKDHTEWFAVSFFGKLAEIAGEYLKKGAPVYIEGRIRTDKWEKDGQTHYRTKIIADRMQMLGSRPPADSGGGGGGGGGGSQETAHRTSPSQGLGLGQPQQHTGPGGAGAGPSASSHAGGGRGGAFDDMDSDIPF